MEVRAFFGDGTNSAYQVQTYHKNSDSLYTLVLLDGSKTVLDNVNHMINIKWLH